MCVYVRHFRPLPVSHFVTSGPAQASHFLTSAGKRVGNGRVPSLL